MWFLILGVGRVPLEELRDATEALAMATGLSFWPGKSKIPDWLAFQLSKDSNSRETATKVSRAIRQHSRVPNGRRTVCFGW